MLILSRKMGEAVVIGEGDNRVVVTVGKVKGKTVKVGIDAPAHVPIKRDNAKKPPKPNAA